MFRSIRDQLLKTVSGVAAKQMVADASTRTGIDFTNLLFEENDKLEKTEFTQPAILLVSAIAHKLFENEMPIKPVFSLGHSLGEFSALVSVGAIDAIDAERILKHPPAVFEQEGAVVPIPAFLGSALRNRVRAKEHRSVVIRPSESE